MSRKVVPSWKCERCQKWTPHGKYNCQHCGASQPQRPEFGQRASDGSIPPPDEVKKSDKGHAVDIALRPYARSGGLEGLYDDVKSDDRMPEAGD